MRAGVANGGGRDRGGEGLVPSGVALGAAGTMAAVTDILYTHTHTPNGAGATTGGGGEGTSPPRVSHQKSTGGWTKKTKAKIDWCVRALASCRERREREREFIEHELRGFAKSPVNLRSACVCTARLYTHEDMRRCVCGGTTVHAKSFAPGPRGTNEAKSALENNIRHALMGFWEMELKSTLMF